MSDARYQATVDAPDRGGASVARFLGAAILLAGAGAALSIGPLLPAWLRALGGEVGLSPDGTIRWTAALLGTVGVAAVFRPRSAAVLLGLGGAFLAFAGLATISGSLGAASAARTSGLLLGTLVAATGAALLFALSPRAHGHHQRPGRRGLSPAWDALGSMVLLGLLATALGRAPIRTASPLITVSDFGTPDATVGANLVNFEFDRWEGQSIRTVGLDRYLPEFLPTLDAVAPAGDAYLVFYNPRCSHCHELFREHFAGALDIPVIAIEIPPPPGGTLVETDEPTEIECPDCRFLALPATMAWGVTPPAVVRIEGGVVRCAVEANAFETKDCFARR